jgi:hypothetical protein
LGEVSHVFLTLGLHVASLRKVSLHSENFFNLDDFAPVSTVVLPNVSELCLGLDFLAACCLLRTCSLSLETLDLKDCFGSLDETVLMQIAECAALRQLSLILPYRTDIDLSILKQCELLSSVDLHSHSFASLKSVDGLEHVKDLSLDAVGIANTEDGIPLALEKFRAESILLGEGWSQGPMNATLQEFRLSTGSVQLLCLNELERCLQLRCIDVPIAPGLLPRLLLALWRLESLRVYLNNLLPIGCATLDEQTLALLGSHPSLRVCEFSKLTITARCENVRAWLRVPIKCTRLVLQECYFAPEGVKRTLELNF